MGHSRLSKKVEMWISGDSNAVPLAFFIGVMRSECSTR